MTKSKTIFIITYVLVTAYVLIGSLTKSVSEEGNLCSYKAINTAAPWSSGCFYKAYYTSDNISDEELNSEAHRLAEFAENGGMPADIHLYRIQLHMRYQERLRTNFQDLHNLYLNYTKAEQRNLIFQIEYLGFLYANQLESLAQNTLNQYCDTYIVKGRVARVDEIKQGLTINQIPLDTSSCYNAANLGIN